ncbi:MAG: CvpA family protein [Verrucomicrobiia bacterium]
MIAATIQDFTTDKLPINWFDGALAAFLIIGVFRGRKHGMSREFLPLFQWVTLVLVAGLFYPMAAELLANTAGMGKLSSFIFGYLLLAVAVVFVFLIFKRLLGYRMGENNFFGSGEYYLGMSSGVIRFACMLLAGLALLNAPYYSPADIKAHEAYVKRWFGGGIYSGNYFPDLQTIQESVFKKSFTGPYIKDYLGSVLIETTPTDTKPAPVQKTAVVNIQK